MADTDGSQESLIRREIDLANRDPKQINDTVKVSFEDVIAEPVVIHSLNGVWKTSHNIFEESKSCCYKFLTVIFSVPLSVLWGFLFACLSFWHIWAVVPCVQSCHIMAECVRRPYLLALHIYLDPLCESLGRIYSGVRVVLRKEV